MRRVRFSLFVFMLLALTFAGVIGFSNLENMGVADSFHATVANLTFSGNPEGFSNQGKLLATALTLASVTVIVWAFVNFHSTDVSQQPGDYFKFIPQDEGLLMKEIKIAGKSHLAGLKKIDILQKTGTVVFGLKTANTFRLSVPFEKRIPGNSRILVLGNSLQLKEVEKEARSS